VSAAKGAGVGKAGSGSGKKLKSGLTSKASVSGKAKMQKASVKTARGTRTNIRRMDSY